METQGPADGNEQEGDLTAVTHPPLSGDNARVSPPGKPLTTNQRMLLILIAACIAALVWMFGESILGHIHGAYLVKLIDGASFISGCW